MFCDNSVRMKQYVIDELRPVDHQQMKSYLDRHLDSSEIGGIYWLPLNVELLTPVQKSHQDCQPHFFALELEPNRLACELLVRTKQRVRCDCIAYATREQVAWLIDFTDAMLEKLNITI